MSDVAQVTTMHRVASARVTHEILRATDGFLRQCRKPHGSRVFFTSELLPAKSRHSCAVIFLLRDAGARLHEDGWSQAKIFFTGCSRKRARRRIRDRKRANQCLVIRCIGRHATSGAVAAGVLRHLRCGDSCVAQSAVTRIRHGARSTDPLRAPGGRVATMPWVERACARAAAAVFSGDI